MLLTLTVQIFVLLFFGTILLLLFSRSFTSNSFSRTSLEKLPKVATSLVIPITIDQYKLIGEMTVGTAKREGNGQVLKTHFNLFSTMSWLHSVEMCKKRKCDKEPFTPFDGSKSETYKKKKSPLKFTSGTSSFAGVISEDQFKYGGQKETTWATFQFLELSEKSDYYEGYDATLGLNLQEKSTIGHETAVMGMLAQMVDPVFGIYIHKASRNGEHGSLVVGGNDAGFMAGPLRPHNVLLTDKGSLSGWTISIEKVVIIYKDGTRKEKKLSMNVAAPAPGLEDIILPPADAREVVDNTFQGVSFYHQGRTFSCHEDRSALPDIALVMDGEEYVLAPEEYVRSTTSTGAVCAVAIGEYPSKILLGRPFMRKFYTRFDIGNKQLQFAAAKHPLESTAQR